ncbi:MAG: hypothetical protein DHS20C01_12990 [marine bacterium B5-7]|nr:MAG: hypothetical protein DHS20C01_12990 [marine bacterium B5-7]
MVTRSFSKLAVILSTAGVLAVPAYSLAQSPITASLDTGVDNDQMTDVRVPGFDFVDNDADTNDRSSNSHGTFQALIYHDHAPTSRYMSIRTYTGNGDSGKMLLSRGQAAVDFALANPAVKVLMINRLQPIDAGRLQTAAKRDVTVLINSGNQGQPNPQGSATLIPQLGGKGLIVAAHTEDGTIWSKSNRPGPAFAEHTITALYNTPRTDVEGTSFALPRVAATAVRLKTLDPHLTPFQIVEIIKRTARDAGAPGVDSVYGYGLLDANAAFQAVGTPVVPDGGGGGGGGGGGSSAGVAVAGALVIGGGLYALIKRNKELKRTLILDDYGRSFIMDMSVATTKRDRTPSLNLVMADLEREDRVMQITDNEEVKSYAVLSTNRDNFRALDDVNDLDFRGTEDVSYSFQSEYSSGRKFGFALNDSQRSAFGAMSLIDEGASKIDFLTTESVTVPFMGFTDQGISSMMQFQPADRINVKVGLSANDDQQQWGLESDSAFFETSYETPRYGLAVQVGELYEDGSLFGGSSSGAFSVDSAKTLSIGLSGRYSLTPETSLIGSYTRGFTDVKHKQPSLLSNFSTIETDSFGAGLISRNLFTRGDAFGVGFFQPLRVTSGEVDTTVPYARDIEGNIYSNSGRYSLVPDGAEHVYELYYSVDLGHKSRLGTHLMYRSEPWSDADAQSESVVMFTLDKAFN